MHRALRLTLLTLAVGLSACSARHPVEPPAPPIERAPPQGPVVKPLPGAKPSAQPGGSKPTPKPMPRTSASFAPPPGGASHWDPKLGVYVMDKQPNTFYRQRTYYHYDGGWSWAVSPNGPWQATDASGVPGNLGRAFAQ